jgi:hypothetical protein
VQSLFVIQIIYFRAVYELFAVLYGPQTRLGMSHSAGFKRCPEDMLKLALVAVKCDLYSIECLG